MKKVAVLYSGGLDSTYLVYKNLKEGNQVQPFYITVDNNINKTVIEKQMIVKNYFLFKKEFGNLISEPEINLKLSVSLCWDSPLRFKQIPIWLFALQYMGEYDEYQIGYIANDDAIPFLEDIKNQYKSLDYLFRSDYKRPELTFPLFKHSKEDIINELPTQYFDNVFSCENPILTDEKYLVEFPDNENYISESFKRSFTDDYKTQGYKICGDCDPCRKIMNNYYIFEKYRMRYPDYHRVKIESIIKEYNHLKEDRNRVSIIDEVFTEQEKLIELRKSWEMQEPQDEGSVALVDNSGVKSIDIELG